MIPRFTYKGFAYIPWDDVTDDNVKTLHEVKTQTGEIITFEYNPYNEPNILEFILWVDLKCPTPKYGKFNNETDIKNSIK